MKLIRLMSILGCIAIFSSCSTNISNSTAAPPQLTNTPMIANTSLPTSILQSTKTPIPDYKLALIPGTTEIQQIKLEDYPTSPKNFILDTRTNEEKMALIRNWAPEDVEKEIALYNAEFERVGIDLKDIEYRASIVDGKSWTLYPTHTNGRSYFVSINGIVRPSLDLFGYLDRNPKEDFFDLKSELYIPGGEVVGDKSGWHVFAHVDYGQISKWYDAVHDQVYQVEIEPTPTISLTSTPMYPPIEDFLGIWKNVDRNTQDMTRIEIRTKNNTIYARGWGRCVPSDCDWGITSTTYHGNPIILIWDHGFAIHKLTLVLENKNLNITIFTDFKDAREDQTYSNNFRK